MPCRLPGFEIGPSPFFEVAEPFGDIAIMLQLVPRRTIADAVPMAGRLDETGIRSLDG